MTRVAIIGCGVVGAAIAYELSLLPNLEITVIDCHQPAQGSTQAALGVLMGIISHKVKGRLWRLREQSIRRYHTLIRELEAIAPISFNRQGILMLCFPGEDMAQWEKLAATRHTQGWQLELLEPREVRQRYPQLGTVEIVGAVHSPQDGQVDPVVLTRALVRAAQGNGVRFRFSEGVERINYTETDSGKRCDRLEMTGGNLAVDWLVMSAGLGSTPLTAGLESPVEIRPVLGQAIHLRLETPMGNGESQPVITGEDVHIVPSQGGDYPVTDYWVGATVEFTGEGDPMKGDPALLQQVLQRAIAFCPDLASGEIVRTWSGLRPRPEGQPAPLIGPLAGFGNVLLATGHYRNGVLLAPATALEIRQAIAGS
ncbi:FAD-binding oxidoreductase [Laspinema sp. A4]|uniref:NAD(P)/FAD-dependent oxidoreductase n=1 Tax=Laspinema sp. D2d TaxID=2953686 RepID=UPI0021BACEFE|nr:FAD-dependent oxidoreductase [Laspinema sp. D2d]MCT7981916.1 FAD-binding oxidoreductase [Laspinema sp. D2d]